MNNRFNFRMWDINTKRFYYMYLDELIGLTRTISIPKEATIQQYTGLTDKNGKEIFEGDIIIDTQKQKYEIIFDENHARYDLKISHAGFRSASQYSLLESLHPCNLLASWNLDAMKAPFNNKEEGRS